MYSVQFLNSVCEVPAFSLCYLLSLHNFFDEDPLTYGDSDSQGQSDGQSPQHATIQPLKPDYARPEEVIGPDEHSPWRECRADVKFENGKPVGFTNFRFAKNWLVRPDGYEGD